MIRAPIGSSGSFRGEGDRGGLKFDETEPSEFTLLGPTGATSPRAYVNVHPIDKFLAKLSRLRRLAAKLIQR